MNYPDTIKDLIECFSKLPSIGKKTAERLALSTIGMSDEVINLFSESLKNIKTKIRKCDICNNYTESDICSICSNEKRNKDILYLDDLRCFLYTGLSVYANFYAKVRAAYFLQPCATICFPHIRGTGLLLSRPYFNCGSFTYIKSGK